MNSRERKLEANKLLDFVGDIIVVVEADQRISYINKMGCKTLGYNKKDVIGKNWFDNFIPERIRNKVKSVFDELMTEKIEPSVEYFENPIKTKKGQEKIIEWHNTVLKNDQGKIYATLSSGRDVTERKKAEEALYHEHNNLINILNSMEDGVYIVNQQYDIKYVNPSLIKEFGSFEGRKCYKYFHDLTDVCPWCKNQDVFAGKTVRWEWYSFKNQRTYDLIDTPLRNPDGSILKLEIFRDITEQKKAEQKLKESEEKYRNILESIKEVYYEVDTHGNFTFLTDKFVELVGYPKNELLGFSYRKIVSKEDVERIYTILDNMQKKDIQEMLFEYTLVKKDGINRFFENSVYLKYDSEGKKIGFYGLARDITERKKAEQKLKESEEKYRELVELLPDIVAEVNNKLEITYANPVAFKLFGYSQEDFNKGLKVIQMIAPEDLEKASKNMKNIFNGEIIEPIDYLLLKKDGTKFYGRINSRPIYKEGKITGLRCVISDITERKKMEIELIESEQQYRTILNSMMDPIHVVDKDLRIIWTNTAFKQWINELDINIEMIGQKVFDAFPFLLKRSINEYKQVLATGEPLLIIDSTKIRNIEIFTETIKIPILSKGEVSQIITIVRDITERKKAEQKIKESEVKYRELVELLPDAISEIDTKFNLTYANSKAFELFGYSQEDFNKGLKVTQMIAPEDLIRAIKVMKRLFNGEIVEPLDYLLIKKDGTKFYGRINYRAIYEEGRIVGYRCVISDITRRKKAEEKIKESEAKYRDAYNLVSFYKDVFTHDMNNILQNILTSVELLSLFLDNPEKSEENKEILQILKSQVKRSANLILNVRKLTKLEETQIGIKSTEAISILRKTIEFIKKSVQDRDILFEVDINFEKVNIQANELLVDIFENILLNAVKYNEDTQVEIIIIISKIQKEGIKYLKIEFKDNGIGVTDPAKEIIFKGGYKRDKKFRGMGLGLSLVKKILESYNGEIWVEDRVPGDYTKGSNFVILIPEIV